MVCEHQMVELRSAQFTRRLSPVSILSVLPACGPKSASPGGESDQGSATTMVPALPPRKLSDPTGPCSLLMRIALVLGLSANSPAIACTIYSVLGLRLS